MDNVQNGEVYKTARLLNQVTMSKFNFFTDFTLRHAYPPNRSAVVQSTPLVLLALGLWPAVPVGCCYCSPQRDSNTSDFRHS
jgi:hypothetical protein